MINFFFKIGLKNKKKVFNPSSLTKPKLVKSTEKQCQFKRRKQKGKKSPFIAVYLKTSSFEFIFN